MFMAGRRLTKTWRVLAATLALALVLAAMPLASAMAYSSFTAEIRSMGGAVMGTATFTEQASGEVTVEIHVTGFDPLAGDRRVAIRSVGSCWPPSVNCAGSEMSVLPNLQMMPDGSADYVVTTNAVNVSMLTNPSGSAIVIYADVNAGSAFIGYGVIVGASSPGPYWDWDHGNWAPQQPYQPQPDQPQQPSVSFGAATTVVAPAGLKMRQSASLTAPVVLTLNNGAVVYPSSWTDYSSGISWIYIRAMSGGRAYDGWVASNYLAAYARQPAPARGR
jgi:Cu/Zn superoxide dismutase